MTQYRKKLYVMHCYQRRYDNFLATSSQIEYFSFQKKIRLIFICWLEWVKCTYVVHIIIHLIYLVRFLSFHFHEKWLIGVKELSCSAYWSACYFKRSWPAHSKSWLLINFVYCWLFFNPWYDLGPPFQQERKKENRPERGVKSHFWKCHRIQMVKDILWKLKI